jgi:hypothetical protein
MKTLLAGLTASFWRLTMVAGFGFVAGVALSEMRAPDRAVVEAVALEAPAAPPMPPVAATVTQRRS